ncbi:hypothetical protein [Spongiivirga citrea]|uniref:DUF4129 domain-containing protein n=1 Tax=Spongiivirga citrea TaxID=1481457 RepID=A0A6M0CQ62_9FLAO|nr:hypothetical protein [Spongiivirga citrea]NER16070.1 hypothetical protein [Spongiivirga citrea]
MSRFLKHINFIIIPLSLLLFVGQISYAQEVVEPDTEEKEESILHHVKDPRSVLEDAEDNSARSPREFQEDLNEIYEGEEYRYDRETNPTGWWARFKESWRRFWDELFGAQRDASASGVVRILYWIGGIALLGLVIYFIVRAIMNDEGNWIFGRASDKGVVNAIDVETNIHETDFIALVKQAKEEKNYRLAVRYYYLWVLKNLSSKELIEYDVEKTNSDYQHELKDKNLQKDFGYTSYLYNYIWYGEFDVNEDEFKKASAAFDSLIKATAA